MEPIEYPRNDAGRRIFPSDFKQKVIAEIEAGETVAALARRYGIAIRTGEGGEFKAEGIPSGECLLSY